jgi:CheY-like chemotaxis protein
MSQTPTVYFIDDSATMREVIKIAFRRESMNVVACHSGDAALNQMEQVPPDVVISDLIMPEKDGYEICQYVKTHPRLNRTPVILMSGVVNRAVAEKAFSVKADELIRKPFQPQDLIARVRHLLNPKGVVQHVSAPATAAAAAPSALSSIFAAPAIGMPGRGASPLPRPLTPFAPAQSSSTASSPRVSMPPRDAAAGPRPAPLPPPRPAPPTAEAQRLKVEVARLEGLIKKLQAELQAEREYSKALEEHVKTLQDVD